MVSIIDTFHDTHIQCVWSDEPHCQELGPDGTSNDTSNDMLSADTNEDSENGGLHDEVSNYISSSDNSLRSTSSSNEAKCKKPSSPDPPPSCVCCKKIGQKRCGGCHNAHYCSTGCQKPRLASAQASLQDLRGLPRPTRRELLPCHSFPVNETRPRYIWLNAGPCGINPKQTKEIFGDSHVAIMTLDCCRPLIRKLGYTVQILCSDSFLIDGSRPNMAIKKLNGIENAKVWRDSFIAFGTEGDAEGDADDDGWNYRDLDATVLATILDFFKFRAKNPSFGYGFALDFHRESSIKEDVIAACPWDLKPY